MEREESVVHCYVQLASDAGHIMAHQGQHKENITTRKYFSQDGLEKIL